MNLYAVSVIVTANQIIMDSPLRDMETEVVTTLGRMIVGWVGCFIIGMYVAFLIDEE